MKHFANSKIKTFLLVTLVIALCFAGSYWIHSTTRVVNVKYTPDVCLSLNGCCPEDKSELGSLCRRETIVAGFPINKEHQTADEELHTYTINTLIFLTFGLGGVALFKIIKGDKVNQKATN